MTFKSLILGERREGVDLDLIRKFEKILKDAEQALNKKDYVKVREYALDFAEISALEVINTDDETLEKLQIVSQNYQKVLDAFHNPNLKESREDELAQAKLIQKYADKLEKLAKAEKDKKKRSFFNMIVNALSL